MKLFAASLAVAATLAVVLTSHGDDRFQTEDVMNGTANHLEYDNFQDAIAASFGGTKSEIPAEYK